MSLLPRPELRRSPGGESDDVADGEAREALDAENTRLQARVCQLETRISELEQQLAFYDSFVGAATSSRRSSLSLSSAVAAAAYTCASTSLSQSLSDSESDGTGDELSSPRDARPGDKHGRRTFGSHRASLQARAMAAAAAAAVEVMLASGGSRLISNDSTSAIDIPPIASGGHNNNTHHNTASSSSYHGQSQSHRLGRCASGSSNAWREASPRLPVSEAAAKHSFSTSFNSFSLLNSGSSTRTRHFASSSCSNILTATGATCSATPNRTAAAISESPASPQLAAEDAAAAQERAAQVRRARLAQVEGRLRSGLRRMGPGSWRWPQQG